MVKQLYLHTFVCMFPYQNCIQQAVSPHDIIFVFHQNFVTWLLRKFLSRVLEPKWIPPRSLLCNFCWFRSFNTLIISLYVQYCICSGRYKFSPSTIMLVICHNSKLAVFFLDIPLLLFSKNQHPVHLWYPGSCYCRFFDAVGVIFFYHRCLWLIGVFTKFLTVSCWNQR